MTTDVETMLTRELHEVADSVAVPPVPSFARTAAPAPLPTRRWVPLLAAAAALAVAGTAAVLALRGGDEDPLPAPQPTIVPDGPLSTAPPSVTHVDGAQRLFVDGQQVPGTWYSVQAGGGAWLAQGDDPDDPGDYRWAAGNSPEAQRIDGAYDQGMTLSPGGTYVAGVLRQGSTFAINGFETREGGEGFGLGSEPLAGSRAQPPWVVAVTDDGLVVARDSEGNALYRVADGTTVRMSDEGWTVVAQTAAGLVVTDAEDAGDAQQGQVRLADVDADGRLSLGPVLPAHDELSADPSGTWLAWIEPGAYSGDVLGAGRLAYGRVGDGDGEGAAPRFLSPPGDYLFGGAMTWETSTRFVVPLAAEGRAAMARCDVVRAECVELDPAP